MTLVLFGESYKAVEETPPKVQEQCIGLLESHITGNTLNGNHSRALVFEGRKAMFGG